MDLESSNGKEVGFAHDSETSAYLGDSLYPLSYFFRFWNPKKLEEAQADEPSET